MLHTFKVMLYFLYIKNVCEKLHNFPTNSFSINLCDINLRILEIQVINLL